MASFAGLVTNWVPVSCPVDFISWLMICDFLVTKSIAATGDGEGEWICVI